MTIDIATTVSDSVQLQLQTELTALVAEKESQVRNRLSAFEKHVRDAARAEINLQVIIAHPEIHADHAIAVAAAQREQASAAQLVEDSSKALSKARQEFAAYKSHKLIPTRLV